MSEYYLWPLYQKAFLREIEGLEIGAPKGVIRGFLQVGLAVMIRYKVHS